MCVFDAGDDHDFCPCVELEKAQNNFSDEFLENPQKPLGEAMFSYPCNESRNVFQAACRSSCEESVSGEVRGKCERP
jgi:hypothetical protein